MTLKENCSDACIITMPNLRYMVQLFSERKTTGLICDAEVEETVKL